jgi:hypothetical protein
MPALPSATQAGVKSGAGIFDSLAYLVLINQALAQTKLFTE